MHFEPDPFLALLIGTAVFLYIRAVRILGRRGRKISRTQQAAWYCGITLEAVALLSPLDYYINYLLSAHMIEHLLLADIGVPFLLFGLRAPVLLFFLPRPLTAWLARRRGLRAAFRKLRIPLVAIPIYVVVLYGWHIAPAFEGALRNPFLHALQHESFFLAGVLVWWSAIEPHRFRMSGELWKIGHIVGARVMGMFLGMAFVFTNVELYAGFYGNRSERFGLTPIHDQQLAGGLMICVDFAIIIFSLCYFFWRASQGAEATDAVAQPVEITQ